MKVFEKVLFLAVPLGNLNVAATSSVRFVGVATTLITIQDEPIESIEERAQHLPRCSDTCSKSVPWRSPSILLKHS